MIMTLYPHGMRGVYQIRNVVNGKAYIGSSTDTEGRWWIHQNSLKIGNHHCPHLVNAWRKYGPDAFVFEVLEECINHREREQEIIRSFDPSLLYNVKSVLDRFVVESDQKVRRQRPRSDKARQSQSQAMTGRKNTPEQNEKIRQARLGTKRSDETREKLRLSHLGLKRSLEAIEKSRVASTGRKHTEEAREKMSRSNTGKTRSLEVREHLRRVNLGKTQSLETREKRSRTMRRTFFLRRTAEEAGARTNHKLKLA